MVNETLQVEENRLFLSRGFLYQTLVNKWRERHRIGETATLFAGLM